MKPNLAGVELDGRYRLVAPLGDGAMGSVYRGERLGLGREVAIKLMNTALPGEMAARERFEREAQVMAKLAHPHCVSVIDFGVHEDKPFLVMELVRGDNLHTLIVREIKLPDKRAADIARQILAGLAHAHAQGIIHRDIKPANVMVSAKEALGEHVQILDFGLARLCESSSLLTSGITVGTPSYMAPEQVRGAPLDARTDLYACGVVIYEMVTGGKPFVAGDPLAIATKHLTQPAPPLAGPLGDVVARALAKAPGDRFASAVDMAAAIEAAMAPIPELGSSAIVAIDEPEPPPRPPAPPRPPEPTEATELRRMLPASRMKWFALLLVILAAGGIYGIVRGKAYLAGVASGVRASIPADARDHGHNHVMITTPKP